MSTNRISPKGLRTMNVLVLPALPIRRTARELPGIQKLLILPGLLLLLSIQPEGASVEMSCISAVFSAETKPPGAETSPPNQPPVSRVRLLAMEPTPLYIQKDRQLLQTVEISLENSGEPVEAKLVIKWSRGQVSIPLGKLAKGKSTVQAHLPHLEKGAEMEWTLFLDGKPTDRGSIAWQPGRLWEVCLVPICHHDLGYTDSIENVLRLYEQFYDQVLRFCAQTDDFPEEAKFRYTVEGSWSLQHYLENRPPETAEKLGKYLREGRIEVQALYGNLITNLLAHEEQIRALYPSFRMKRRFGAPIRTASTTDIPGLSWGLPTVLAGAGVDSFFAGLATYFEWERRDIHSFWDESAILRHGRPDAFWWEGPDGGRILVYYQGGYGCWSPDSYEDVLDNLPRMLREMEKQGTPFSVVRFAGYGCGDNTPPSLRPSQIVREWNSRWAYPRLYVATNAMFFEKLHRQCQQQKDIRTFRGDLPETDYVVGATSTARETIRNRLTHDQLPTAEKWAAVATLMTGAGYPAQELAQAYDNMLLYDEHTWGMHSGLQVSRRQDWSWSDKARYAYRAAGLAEDVLEQSVQHLASQVRRSEEGRYIVVFNPLGFARTDLVRITKFGSPDQGFDPANPPELVDLQTGARVACQIVEISSPHLPVSDAAARYGRGQFNPSERFELVFVAEDVPPLGWKSYRLAPAAKQRPSAAPSPEKPSESEGKPLAGQKASAVETPLAGSLRLGPNSLENRFFRLVLNPQTGAIQSLYDKELRRELVDPAAPHGLGQLVVKEVQTAQLAEPQKATIQPGQTGPVYASLLVSGQALGCPQVSQEIILYEKLKRVDLAVRVLRDATPMLELYIAFPFQMDKPQFALEGPHSVIRPFEDQLPGSNTNYYAVQHWAAVSDGRHSAVVAPLEAHLVEFGGLWPCYVSQAHHGVTAPDFGRPFARQEEITKGYIYSFLHASNFRTNFPVLQQADLLWRFSVTSLAGEWRSGRAGQFGWSSANPLLGVLVEGKADGPLEPVMSICQVEPPHLLLLAVKQAEDGQGMILRLWESVGQPGQAKLQFPHHRLQKAWLANLVEENQTELPTEDHHLRVAVKPFQPVTLRVLFAE